MIGLILRDFVSTPEAEPPETATIHERNRANAELAATLCARSRAFFERLSGETYILPGVSGLNNPRQWPEIFVFMDQKHYDSREAIYDGRYDLAIQRTQEILDFNPYDVRALEIMGSAYLMNEENVKARAAWQKALALDPDNKVVKDFIAQVH